QAAGQGYSIRQTAQALGIAPKTVENIQTRLFRKLGVRNRSGALAVADALGLLAGPATAQAWPAADPAAPWGDPSPALDDGPGSYWSGEDWRPWRRATGIGGGGAPGRTGLGPAQEGAAGPEPFPDLLGDLPFDQFRGEQA